MDAEQEAREAKWRAHRAAISSLCDAEREARRDKAAAYQRKYYAEVIKPRRAKDREVE